MDSAVLIFGAIVGVALVALVVGRWWALALPSVVVPLLYLGLGRGWWGAGLGDSWEFAMVGVWALAVGTASVAVAVRALARSNR